MQMSGMVTLTTDFGWDDPFVGQMKGALLSVFPRVVVVDVTHGIPSHDIEAGAWVVASSWRHFPVGTVHLTVVDPGVGGQDRRPVIVAVEGHLFVGPDNGLFSGLPSGERRVYEITAPAYRRPDLGPTFHGRDLFAPVAARLAQGVTPETFGVCGVELCVLALPQPERTAEGIRGQVVRIDKFGNAITNIPRDWADAGPWRLVWRDKKLPLATAYSTAPDQGLSALFNSDGFLEVFVRQGNAAAACGVARGDRVVLTPAPPAE